MESAEGSVVFSLNALSNRLGTALVVVSFFMILVVLLYEFLIQLALYYTWQIVCSYAQTVYRSFAVFGGF
jgi:hypothetical protein